MADIFITFFLETKSDNATLKTVYKVQKRIDNMIKEHQTFNCDLLKYEIQIDKKKPSVTIIIDANYSKWYSFVYELFLLAQSIGRAWTITGSIEHSLDLFSNKPIALVGVSAVSFCVDNKYNLI